MSSLSIPRLLIFIALAGALKSNLARNFSLVSPLGSSVRTPMSTATP
jgi:hypothetical protein